MGCVECMKMQVELRNLNKANEEKDIKIATLSKSLEKIRGFLRSISPQISSILRQTEDYPSKSCSENLPNLEHSSRLASPLGDVTANHSNVFNQPTERSVQQNVNKNNEKSNNKRSLESTVIGPYLHISPLKKYHSSEIPFDSFIQPFTNNLTSENARSCLNKLLLFINKTSNVDLTAFLNSQRMIEDNEAVQLQTTKIFVSAIKHRLVGMNGMKKPQSVIVKKNIKFGSVFKQLEFSNRFLESEIGVCVLLYVCRHAFKQHLFRSLMSFLHSRAFSGIKSTHIKCRFVKVFSQVYKFINDPVPVRVLLFDVLAINFEDKKLEIVNEILDIYPEIIPADSNDLIVKTVKRIMSFHVLGEDPIVLREIFNSIMENLMASNNRSLTSEIKSLQLLSVRLDSQEAVTQLINISSKLQSDPALPLIKIQAYLKLIGFLSRNPHEHVKLASQYLRESLETILNDGDINKQISVAATLISMASQDCHIEPILIWKSNLDPCIILPPSISTLRKQSNE